MHFKFKFDSENDYGVLTIFLNDSGSTECEREIASCSQTVQITLIVEFASGTCKSMHNRSLASQTHFRKRGKGLVNCVYKPCPAALYSAVQPCCSILSHDTLHHCLSSNSSLENSEREQGHLSRCYSNRKNTSRIVFREGAYSATGNSRVYYFEIWLRHPANCIPVGQGLYTQFTRPFPLLRKWVWLARLAQSTLISTRNLAHNFSVKYS